MGYSKEIYRLTKAKMEERRTNAERRADAVRAEVYRKVPKIEALEREISSCGILAVRAVLKGGDAKTATQELKKKSLAMQSEVKRLLVQNGYEEDCFEPHYYCNDCRDTGYIEKDGKTVYCRCFKKLLVATACEELNRTAPLRLSTFESFNLDLYSRSLDEKSGFVPYDKMEKIFNYCVEYAKTFSTASKSLLMRGGTGLGKTHLSLAIANEVTRRGFGVIYVSAPMLVSTLSKMHFSKTDDDTDYIEMLTHCDLLIIDDLGTEFATPFTTTQFYNLCNSRMLLGMPLIINTNLTINELEKTYSPRFVSRIYGDAVRLNFIGEDVRIKKNFSD